MEAPQQLISLQEVIDALKSRDQRMIDWATQALAKSAPTVLPHLVRHATDARKTAIHRCRLLRVVRQIGGEVGLRARWELHRMALEGPKTVQMAARRVLQGLMPDEGPPPRRPPGCGKARRRREFAQFLEGGHLEEMVASAAIWQARNAVGPSTADQVPSDV